MQNLSFLLAYGIVLISAAAGRATAQDKGEQQPLARRQLQQIHTPQSIDQELARLSKDLELTTEQQKQVRPILMSTMIGFKLCLIKILQLRGRSLLRISMPSVTKRTVRFMFCLPISRGN
jgi:hypothetical protein